MGAREAMIEAGERIAAERGIGAMSLREVQAAAGQRNKSAAQYHFGSREGLIEAIVATRMGPINQERRRRLRQLDDAGREPTRRQLMEVLVEPLAEATLRPTSCWARFLLQGVADPAITAIVRRTFEGRVYREVRQRLIDRMDHVPAVLAERRVDHAIGLAVVSLAGAESGVASARPGPIAPAAVVADLVDMCTAVVDAPASPSTLAALGVARTRPA